MEPTGTGTRNAKPVSFPSSSGMILPMVRAAPDEVGMVDTAAARAVLGVPPAQPAVIESVEDFMRRVAQYESMRCPHCHVGTFRVVATLRPERYPLNLRGPP